MSGDLRAKKGVRKELSKSTSAGRNKRNRAKGLSQFQHDSPGVYEGSHESDDLDQAEDVFPNKKSNSETEDEEDRAVKVKPVRRTKRRELNKQSKKQQVRRYRQQTPPPPNYIILDDDSEEYDKQKNETSERTMDSTKKGIWDECSGSTILYALLVILCIIGISAFVASPEKYQSMVITSEEIQGLASILVLPDVRNVCDLLSPERLKSRFMYVQDLISGHLSSITIQSTLEHIQSINDRAMEHVCFAINQFNISARETSSNIVNFIYTIIDEMKSGMKSFDAISQLPTEGVTNPNDDSEDYTPELNEWIESGEKTKETIENYEQADVGLGHKDVETLLTASPDSSSLNDEIDESINTKLNKNGPDEEQLEVETSTNIDKSEASSGAKFSTPDEGDSTSSEPHIENTSRPSDG